MMKLVIGEKMEKNNLTGKSIYLRLRTTYDVI